MFFFTKKVLDSHDAQCFAIETVVAPMSGVFSRVSFIKTHREAQKRSEGLCQSTQLNTHDE
jgi:hypothetical protein